MVTKMADEIAMDPGSNRYEVVHAKSPVFYDHYERKAELQHQTHYCPGCGHGIVHKLIAEAIQELGLQDKTIFVSPVGCSVFAYYYFDLGNVQVAHGRAPAAATAIKRVCPEKIVISYQGDGDLAAIGTAEIIHAANRGEKISVFFINNGIYGMTGGQMAPTTLLGQKSTTSPWGRSASSEGFPLHMAEMLATLEAPAYIERVALCDNKNIMRAGRAVRKALELQRDAAGFTFVEILSPCPTIWGKNPVEARNWLSDAMVPIFPLSVFRDHKPEVLRHEAPPQRSLPDVLDLTARGEHGFPRCTSVPSITGRDAGSEAICELGIRIAGFGGQGVLLLGQLLAEMGMREDLEVSWLPSYGPEMRSGSANCHVRLSNQRIGGPLVPCPNVLIAMNEVSLRKFASDAAPAGVVLYNGATLPEGFEPPETQMICVPAARTAEAIGTARAANVVMLGAFLAQTGCLSFLTAMQVLQEKIKDQDLLEMDRKALLAGRELIQRGQITGAVSQPDGFA